MIVFEASIPTDQQKKQYGACLAACKALFNGDWQGFWMKLKSKWDYFAFKDANLRNGSWQYIFRSNYPGRLDIKIN